MNKENEQRWLQEIEAIVIQHISEPQFSVNYLADELEMNRAKLYQKMKDITGTTPNQYIRDIRLALAKTYLEAEMYHTVKEVANQIGFTRVDYFSQLYKDKYGVLPSSYFKR